MIGIDNAPTATPRRLAQTIPAATALGQIGYHTEEDCTETRALERPHVLVVEDDFIIAADIAAAVREAGGVVLGPAPSAEATSEILAASRVDAAVLDVRLGHRPVFSVARELRARGIPFVFATAIPTDRMPAEFASIRSWKKPFDVDEMAAAFLRPFARRRP